MSVTNPLLSLSPSRAFAFSLGNANPYGTLNHSESTQSAVTAWTNSHFYHITFITLTRSLCPHSRLRPCLQPSPHPPRLPLCLWREIRNTMTLCPVPWVVRVRLNWAQSTQRGSWFHARILSLLIFESSCEVMLMDNRQRGIECQLEMTLKRGRTSHVRALT